MNMLPRSILRLLPLVFAAAAFPSASRCRGADIPGQQTPRQFDATLISHVTYERRETWITTDESSKDRRYDTLTFSASSNAPVVCQTDEWGILRIDAIPGKKAVSTANGSRSISDSITFSGGSYLKKWSSVTGQLAPDASLPIGACNIDNNQGNHKDMTISLLASAQMKGMAHSHQHFAPPDPTPDIVRDGPVEESFGPGTPILPVSQRPANFDPKNASKWYGATTQILPHNGYRVIFGGSRTIHSDQGPTVTETMQVSVDLIAGKPIPADMDLAPADAAAFDQYLPVPVSDDPAVIKLFGQNAPISFTATLSPKKPTDPPPLGIIDFYLTNVSQHQGICGNYPPNASEKPGLEFVASPGITVDPGDSAHAYTTAAVGSASVLVKASETGAYGKISATCDDVAAEAVYKRTGQKFMDIPRDDNHNHIADAWEKSAPIGIYSKNYPATWDEENTPKNDHKGDGLTLYEEYRGFVFNAANDTPAFGRLSPATKKVFVYPQGSDVGLYKTGISKWSEISGIKTFVITDKTELKSDNSDPVDISWLNFNSSTDDGVDFGDKQHAVVIRPSTLAQEGADPGTWGQTKPLVSGNEGSVCPNEIYHVAIMRDGLEGGILAQMELYPPLHAPSHDYQWLVNHGSSPQQVAQILANNAQMSQLFNEAVTFSVIHELGHATGAQHHGLPEMAKVEAANGNTLPPGVLSNDFFSTGEPTCPMFYWFNKDNNYIMPFILGKWDPTKNAWLIGTKPDDFGSPTPWVYCTDDAAKIALHR